MQRRPVSIKSPFHTNFTLIWQFQILAGVRQGGVLSPCLFAVFIDSIVRKLRLAGDCASIGRHYLGCMLYANDIMLVCNSITAMQRMLDI